MTALPMRQVMRENAAKRLHDITLRMFAPKPDMTSSEFADEFGVLIEGDKVRPWKTHDIQREPLDAMGDVTVPEMVWMASARVGKSETVNNEIHRRIEHDPCAMLMYRPKEADAKRWIDKRFEPKVRALDSLKSLSFLTAAGKRKEVKTEREFKNGASLMVLGAESEDNFRDHTVKFIVLDELDAVGFAPVKGGGNKYDMARRRGYQYWDSKVVAVSTPKFPADQGGRIHKLFLESDQRHYHVCCPHCGYEFVPEWGDADSVGGMRWDKDDPSVVWYECHNPDLPADQRCKIQDHEKHDMMKPENGAKWVPHNPSNTTRRGYHSWQWYSKSPKAAWHLLVKEWLEALRGGADDIQSFKNEVLGLPYSTKEGQEVADWESLARCVTDLGPGVEVPDWAEGLIFSIDRQKGGMSDQDSYLEAACWAYGKGRRSFMVAHWVLDEFPQSDTRAWDELEKLITRPFVKEDGTPVRVVGVAVDHNGDKVQYVMNWLEKARKTPGRKSWLAVRGESLGNGRRKASKEIWPDTSAKNNSLVFTIDVDHVKDEIEAVIGEGRLEFNARSIEGSVNLSDPAELERYLKRFLLEKKYFVPDTGGWKWHAPKGLGRNGNEPFDCFVYYWALTYGLAKMAGPERLRFARLFNTTEEEEQAREERMQQARDAVLQKQEEPPVSKPFEEKPAAKPKRRSFASIQKEAAERADTTQPQKPRRLRRVFPR